MSEEQSVGEAALHAFVDNELDVEAGREVETWLRQRPDQLQNITVWKTQNEELKTAFNPILDEIIPKNIQETLNKSAPPKKAFLPLKKIANGIMIFLIGMGIGWFSGPLKRGQLPDFALSAMSSHLVFASDISRPVEFAAPQQNYLLAWVKHRMEKSITPPALTFAGFKFLGGRVLPHKNKPAVLFMYEDVNGKRITILIGQNTRSRRTAIKLWSRYRLHCYSWFRGRLSFAVTSNIEKDKLRLVSEKVESHFVDI